MDFHASFSSDCIGTGEMSLEGFHRSLGQYRRPHDMLSSNPPFADGHSSHSHVSHPLFSEFECSLQTLADHHQQEVDRLLQLQNEQLRLSLHQQINNHLVDLRRKLEEKASKLLRMKDYELTMMSMKHQELLEQVKRSEESKETWQKIAKEMEAMALSLRSRLEQVQQPCLSSTKVTSPGAGHPHSCSSRGGREQKTLNKSQFDKVLFPCKGCGSANTSMFLLPCRHLCACRQCAASLDACPICNGEKVGYFEVILD